MRLLLVTYYYPPSGGPGVQRMLKLSKYLSTLGVSVTVLTVRPETAAYPMLDRSLSRDIHENVVLLRTFSWDPYGVFAFLQGKKKADSIEVGLRSDAEHSWVQRLGRWIRGNIFLPDARVGWVPFAFARGLRAHRKEPFDVVLTSGPPHSTHLVGRLLARFGRLPWVADFRDPWVDIDFKHMLPKSAIASRLDAWLERNVVTRCHALVTVSHQWAMDFQARYGGNLPMSVIHNGFDPADFPHVPTPSTYPFTIEYFGGINRDRHPGALLSAMKHLNAEDRPRIVFTGPVDGHLVQEVVRLGLSSQVTYVAYLPHEEAVQGMCRSSILLLLINRSENNGGILPAKIFEYAASGRPILGIGPTDGDAARFFRETGCGEMFDYEDVEGIISYLHRSRAQMPTGASDQALKPYTRTFQAEQFLGILRKVVEQP